MTRRQSAFSKQNDMALSGSAACFPISARGCNPLLTRDSSSIRSGQVPEDHRHQDGMSTFALPIAQLMNGGQVATPFDTAKSHKTRGWEIPGGGCS